MASAALRAQTPLSLTVDVAANRHAINPWIYGINQWTDNGIQGRMRIPLVRWGGDDASSFNWQASLKNNTGDNPWVYENYSISPGFDAFHERNLRTGTTSLGTIPILDWVPKAAGECSFSVSKYGPQKSVNPDNSDCGNGTLMNGKAIVNDPNDAYIPADSNFQQPWIQHIMAAYGPANGGGVRMWSMDNEPEWWDSVHNDVYKTASNGKTGASYDDMMARNIKYALAVKQADPSALITGPVAGGWSGMLFSKQDMYAGWSKAPYQYWDNPQDQLAHGGVAWVAYYLQQMKAAEAQNGGKRLLDALDVHAYITPSSLSGSVGNAAMETLRMTSTRALWDPNYKVPGGGYMDATGTETPPELVPRLRQWVAANYPGTLTAITEYNWGALNTITGAIAQADILGIFGREGLDMGTLWGPPNATDPGAFAFGIFLNYDGGGGQFGDTSVSATSGDPDSLSIFAAQRSDSALTLLLLNKTTNPISASINLANFLPADTGQVWQYSQANLSTIARQADLPVSGSTIAATVPGYSMTLLVIPQSQDAMTVPPPVIVSVSNAGSYAASGLAPGEIVTIFGKGLGPSALANLGLDASGLVSTFTGGVRVRFNGIPAPIVYASASQVAAVVPYEIAQYNSVNLVLEYSGNASAAFPVKVASAVPGVFTNDSSGSGQGAILNVSAGATLNGGGNPAARGDYVAIFATGEGVTSPPVIDGRITGSPLQKPALTCAATIGGQTAPIQYCGAAPGAMAGLLQVNAQVPSSVIPGSNVPVTITIGGVGSQSGVTLAVK